MHGQGMMHIWGAVFPSRQQWWCCCRFCATANTAKSEVKTRARISSTITYAQRRRLWMPSSRSLAPFVQT